MAFKFEQKRTRVRLRHYGQTIRRGESKGLYSTQDAIEARGSMHRLMKPRQKKQLGV